MDTADVKPIPDGSTQVIPALAVDGAASAIDFCGQVLGTMVRVRMEMPGGKFGHAESQFCGDRSGPFEDPLGHRWSVSTDVEDVPSRRDGDAGRAGDDRA